MEQSDRMKMQWARAQRRRNENELKFSRSHLSLAHLSLYLTFPVEFLHSRSGKLQGFQAEFVRLLRQIDDGTAGELLQLSVSGVMEKPTFCSIIWPWIERILLSNNSWSNSDCHVVILNNCISIFFAERRRKGNVHQWHLRFCSFI